MSKMPPHSSASEQALLGAIMRDNSVLLKIARILEPADFYISRHRETYRLMLAMHREGVPIDPLTVWETGKERGFDGILKAVDLHRLYDACFTVQGAVSSANFVREASKKRVVLGWLKAKLEEINSGSALDEKLSLIAGEPVSNSALAIAEYLEHAESFLRAGVTGVRTGFYKYDRELGGVRGLTVLGAPPKVGKSVFALNAATHAAMNDEELRVLYCDLENGPALVSARLLSGFSGKTFEELRSSDGEYSLLRSQAEEKLWNMSFIYRADKVTPDSLWHFLKSYESQPRLVVIDSLQKLKPLEKLRRDSIDRWLREIETLKSDGNVHFLVVSEISRGEKDINYRKPNLGAFKESGDIEYTADVALQFADSRLGKNYKTLYCLANRLGIKGAVAEYSYQDFRFWKWVEVP